MIKKKKNKKVLQKKYVLRLSITNTANKLQLVCMHSQNPYLRVVFCAKNVHLCIFRISTRQKLH